MSKARSSEKICILIGIPVVIIIGTLMHFVYDWSDQNIVIAIIAPVNESVWEHLKLSFFPLFFWWMLSYLFCKSKTLIDFKAWFFACVVSLIVSIIFIASFYYTYTGAFAIHSLFLDILSFILAVVFAQLAAYHIYNYLAVNRLLFIISFLIFILLLSAFILFTFDPPHIPLFLDPQTGTYGI